MTGHPPTAHLSLARFVPSAAGLLLFGVVAILYFTNLAGYLDLLHLMGVKPWAYPFIDSEFMYVMKASWEKGVDIYTAVPDDVVPGNLMVYSPLWPRMPFLSDDKSWTVPVALVTDLLLLLSLSILPPARTRLDLGLLVLATVSGSVCFALERNNIDVWIFLVAVAAGCLLVRNGALRVVAYGLILMVGLLKYYPISLMALAARERPLKAMVVALLAAAAVVVFGVVFWGEILQQLKVIPSGWSGADMIGIVNVPKTAGNKVAAALGMAEGAHRLTELAIRGVLSVVVIGLGVRLARRPGFGRAVARLAPDEEVWLAAGGLLMGGCYLAGQSVGYRGIFCCSCWRGCCRCCGRPRRPACAARCAWRASRWCC